jgi:hypothetical protein
MKTAFAAMLVALVVLAVPPAHARRTLTVKSVEPATTVLRNGKADVTLVVHAAGTDPCLAIVTIEGERPRSLKFGGGHPDTQTLRLTFRNTGRYIIDIGPRAGSADCTKAQAVVSVHESKPAAKTAPSGGSVEDLVVRQQMQAGAEAKKDLRESTTDASRRNKERARERAAACPDGWSMASSEGSRYTCRLIPPRALACPEGTKYYSKGIEIGCR